MSQKLICAFVLISIIAVLGSCNKNDGMKPPPPGEDRKFRFQLYTNKDFSGDHSIIDFSIFIRRGNTTLFDSSFASMEVQNIPNAMNMLLVEKTINGNGQADLEAGFVYHIQNVGISWYIDTSSAGSKFKLIDFAFQ